MGLGHVFIITQARGLAWRGRAAGYWADPVELLGQGSGTPSPPQGPWCPPGLPQLSAGHLGEHEILDLGLPWVHLIQEEAACWVPVGAAQAGWPWGGGEGRTQDG